MPDPGTSVLLVTAGAIITKTYDFLTGKRADTRSRIQTLEENQDKMRAEIANALVKDEQISNLKADLAEQTALKERFEKERDATRSELSEARKTINMLAQQILPALPTTAK